MNKNILSKSILAAMLYVASFSGAKAGGDDEGMWLPLLLSQNNYNDMVKHGLKMTPEQLYSVNKNSMKDAVIWFGGGCTGEVVSNEGLVITNHHCGYDAIASLSTEKYNYLHDGFWALNKESELPANDLSVQFLVSMTDVTQAVMEKLKDIPYEKWASSLPSITGPMVKEATKDTHYEGFVREMFKGNQFYLFVMEKFTDIRLVGTATESIGKFGGDTDNWMWPRHTGDFSMFRIYANKDNKPAPYSKDNVPYKPKHYFPISIKGLQENDYAMVMGFPGRTNRYETSMGVQLAIDETNPSIVKLRDKRLKLMKEEMDKNVGIRLQQASRYAQIANYWKYFIGQTEQLKKNKVWDRKKSEEASFTGWASGKSEYENIFPNLEKAYKEFRPYNKHGVYLREGVFGAPLLSFANAFGDLEKVLMKDTVDKTALENAIKALRFRQGLFEKIYNPAIDQNIAGAMLAYFATDIDKAQHPAYMSTILKSKGKTTEEKCASFAAMVYAKTFLLDTAKLSTFLNLKDHKKQLKQLQKDPAIQCALAFLKNYNDNYKKYADAFGIAVAKEGKAYVKGLMEMSPSRKFYPDANSTMRLTYGNVKSYDPKDAVHYTYYTTLKGVMEKEDPTNEEFEVPAKLKELYMAKDFGQYTDKDGQVPVAFITNNDITGGNSGSPVINANGELIGAAFDGNWEAMSGDISFDEQYKRTICVDIRYILFLVEKMGGAKNLIAEMDIRK